MSTRGRRAEDGREPDALRRRPADAVEEREDGLDEPPMVTELHRLQNGAGNAVVGRLVSRRALSPSGHVLVAREGEDGKPGGGKKGPAEIKDKVKAALAKSKVTLADVEGALFMASDKERADIAGDAAVMADIKAKLSTEDWMRVIAALRVYAPGGTVAHTTAKEADKQITKKFNDHLAKALKAKKSVQGQFVVLTGQDWLDAYYHEFPGELPRGGPTDDEKDTNAFTTTREPKNLIVLNKDKGNAGTTIHEGLHLYQDDAILDKLGGPFNEGVTELLTRKVTIPMGIARTNYAGNFDALTAVEGAVGENVVAEAYFNGKVDGLKKAFIAFRVGQGDKKKDADTAWESLVSHIRKEEWADAKALCR